MEIHKISFKQWPEFSGYYSYPIDSYQKNLTPDSAYSTAYTRNKLWDKRTKYGRARWALLDWLIEQFEAKGA